MRHEERVFRLTGQRGRRLPAASSYEASARRCPLKPVVSTKGTTCGVSWVGGAAIASGALPRGDVSARKSGTRGTPIGGGAAARAGRRSTKMACANAASPLTSDEQEGQ